MVGMGGSGWWIWRVEMVDLDGGRWIVGDGGSTCGSGWWKMVDLDGGR